MIIFSGNITDFLNFIKSLQNQNILTVSEILKGSEKNEKI